jgi:hypothetical protein
LGNISLTKVKLRWNQMASSGPFVETGGNYTDCPYVNIGGLRMQ